MTCLEHLIENCLVKFEKNVGEIRESIENDPNLQYAGITADQCFEICQYIYYSYVPYIIDKQCGDGLI